MCTRPDYLDWKCAVVLTRGQIYDAVGNEYGKPKDVAGEQRTVFTSLADAAFDVCFENILSGCMFPVTPLSRPQSAAR